VKSRRLAGILVAGLSAATLDILYAFLAASQSGRSPTRVLQAIASGLLGAAAFKGGGGAALWGLFAHFLILLVAAGIYFAASRRNAFLRQQPVLAGLGFGVCIYFFMNFLVLPLSAIPFQISYSMPVLVEGLAVHALLVGLPIAVAIWHFCDRNEIGAAGRGES
jgi:hypothetical protein